MRKTFEPQTRVPGATRRIDPGTLMPAFDDKGRPLWNMPAPIRYAKHANWRKHEETGERILEPIMVPIYRGTSASYARWVRGQIRRNQRKAAEAQAALDALNEAEQSPLQEAEAAPATL